MWLVCFICLFSGSNLEWFTAQLPAQATPPERVDESRRTQTEHFRKLEIFPRSTFIDYKSTKQKFQSLADVEVYINFLFQLLSCYIFSIQMHRVLKMANPFRCWSAVQGQGKVEKF